MQQATTTCTVNPPFIKPQYVYGISALSTTVEPAELSSDKPKKIWFMRQMIQLGGWAGRRMGAANPLLSLVTA